ncbi:PREDICTED: KRAB-A domain-containing protein 2-like [Diuraphis noxia]|uniref:KRAB-A domain-containing protein 2-like n=1 Tax=Diuraphis noxia TaxID=143948 RepID=UPI0007638BD3|nr:PREDICTED: KRAB-A domain-containing protein 2-like [Diuraphis noxia]
MAIDKDTMRSDFNKQIQSILMNKREDNNAFLSTSDYSRVIQQVKKSKQSLNTVGKKKTIKDYRLVRKYDILVMNGKEHLIRPIGEKNVVLYYATIEELFDILYETHSAIGHGGRNRMVSELKNNYCNITNETIMVFLKLCVECHKKAVRSKIGVTPKSILHPTFNSRAQIDLIDMQSRCHNDHRFIMYYQEHLTKYIVLKPLKSKCAEEIAYHLIDIFTLFGAPAILQSYCGEQFVTSVINKLHDQWDEVKIDYGWAKHSESQESIERVNRDFQEMLSTWMDKKNSLDWPSALKFIQYEKNRTFHSGLKTSPYEAMFGCCARIDFASSYSPNAEIIKSEEDL